ncbi:hypothetical protein C5S29_04835, partial [ANME-1 cluster archaeon GoMg3.2]|nr:hypothetical protein [ANME-1 cluster archaeon GoMg3.2]
YDVGDGINGEKISCEFRNNGIFAKTDVVSLGLICQI